MTYERKQTLIKAGIVIAAISAFLGLSTALINSNRRLRTYSPDRDFKVEQATTTASIPSFTVSNPQLGFSLSVPEGWTRVEMDGYDSYIHAASKACVNVYVDDYDGSVNQFLYQGLVASMASSSSASLTSYERVDNSTVKYSFRMLDESGMQTHYVTKAWSLDSIVTTETMIPDVYADRLTDEQALISGSFRWDDREDAIPAEYSYFYVSGADLTYAIPEGWETTASDTSITSTDPVTGSTLTVGMTGSSSGGVSYTGMTQLEYGRQTGVSVANFVLTAFENTGDMLRGEATYTANQKRMQMVQYLYTDGTYQCTLTCEMPEDEAYKVIDVVRECMKAFRFNHGASASSNESGSDGTETATIATNISAG